MFETPIMSHMYVIKADLQQQEQAILANYTTNSHSAPSFLL